jgi:hypothetical protein
MPGLGAQPQKRWTARKFKTQPASNAQLKKGALSKTDQETQDMQAHETPFTGNYLSLQHTADEESRRNQALKKTFEKRHSDDKNSISNVR